MREFRRVYQTLIILDSLAILAIGAASLADGRFVTLLPLAGFLAGANAMLHSRTLEGLRPALKKLLLWGGFATLVVMAVVAAVRFVH